MAEVTVHSNSARRLFRWQRLNRRPLVAIAVAATALAAVAAKTLGRAALLPAAGRAWVVSDQLEPADAAAVLGGGLETRPAAAAQLFTAGIVRQILVSDGGTGEDERRNPDREQLIKLGIPAAAITQFSIDPGNTYGEARALALWALRHHVQRIIVPTEIFPSRRVQWIMRRELGHVGVGVTVEALAPRSYDLKDWWKNPQGIDNFRSEIIKYLYYRVAYWRA
jgi:uncharacterized SAM-binding protein YcdF (DUF218 family)